MSLRIRMLAAISTAIVVVSFSGCSSGGIRALDALELRYFTSLETTLKERKGKADQLFEVRLQAVDAASLDEIESTQEMIRRAKLIYGIQDVLKSPPGTKDYVQATRDKIILWHLVETNTAYSARLAARAAEELETKRDLRAQYDGLLGKTKVVLDAQKLLHNHLNASDLSQTLVVTAAIHQELVAFNATLKPGGNPALERLHEVTLQAERQVEKAEDGMEKLRDLWLRLGHSKKDEGE